MSQQNEGFFDIEISEPFVQQLDDNTFTQLYQILKQNFYNEYNQHRKAKQELERTESQIKVGEQNLRVLSKIQEQHQTQKEKIRASLEYVNDEITKLKSEWKAL